MYSCYKCEERFSTLSDLNRHECGKSESANSAIVHKFDLSIPDTDLKLQRNVLCSNSQDGVKEALQLYGINSCKFTIEISVTFSHKSATITSDEYHMNGYNNCKVMNALNDIASKMNKLCDDTHTIISINGAAVYIKPCSKIDHHCEVSCPICKKNQ